MSSRSIFDSPRPHPEASSLVAFSGNRLDRRSEHRDDDCIEKAVRMDGALFYALAGSKLVLKHENEVIDPLFAPYELPELKPDFDEAILLGFEESGAPRLAVPVGVDPENPVDHLKFADCRALMREALLNDAALGEAAQASAMMSWSLATRFCGRCGAKTEPKAGGYRRKCTGCGADHFPRTDPVVIMLAIDVDGDRCLLGRSPHFPPGMYSCLAGFLEPGETIEAAVRRETLEESGIETDCVRYHASQAWPMPHSLMIGCYAEAKSLEISRDTLELEDCRWFSRQDVEAMIEGRHPEEIVVPVSGAVAYRLIRDWLDWPSA